MLKMSIGCVVGLIMIILPTISESPTAAQDYSAIFFGGFLVFGLCLRGMIRAA